MTATTTLSTAPLGAVTVPAIWRYKWVSLRIQGEPDWDALRRAYNRGWDPVPPDERPDNIDLPCEPEKLHNFCLHRMPEQKARRQEAMLAFLNKALDDMRVVAAARQYRPKPAVASALQLTGPTGTALAVQHGGPIATAEDEYFAKQVEVVHMFLHARGLL